MVHCRVVEESITRCGERWRVDMFSLPDTDDDYVICKQAFNIIPDAYNRLR